MKPMIFNLHIHICKYIYIYIYGDVKEYRAPFVMFV